MYTLEKAPKNERKVSILVFENLNPPQDLIYAVSSKQKQKTPHKKSKHDNTTI